MIYKASFNDVIVVAKMANAMWSNHTLEELEQEFSTIIDCENSVVFIMYIKFNKISIKKRFFNKNLTKILYNLIFNIKL